MKIDLGGGLGPAYGYVNLDVRHGKGPFRRRVEDGIPVRDNSVDAVRASHLLEHLPNGQPLIDLFNEVWRVLIPGGTFEVIVPLFGPGNPTGALADPTHVSLWIKERFDYFTGKWKAGADYGICFWELEDWSTKEWDWGTEGHAILRKPCVIA